MDVVIYGGLREASRGQGELRYPVVPLRPPVGPLAPHVLVGGSCDEPDVISEDVLLSVGTGIGDRLRFLHTGAYSVPLASPFCGIAPPTVHVVDTSRTDRPRRGRRLP